MINRHKRNIPLINEEDKYNNKNDNDNSENDVENVNNSRWWTTQLDELTN